MVAEITTVVKVPVSQIASWLKDQHELPEKLESFSLEGDNLVLNFKDDNSSIADTINPSAPLSNTSMKSRKHRKKRNRMKTRGWAVHARFTNSKNQKCTIYRPFVEALQGKQLSADDQRKAVEGILRSNRNRPTEESIEYFLNNTLEYLGGVQH
jgi:hypothetical protein